MPVFADSYGGAMQFMQEKPPGFVTFVSHAGRDIMNLLANEFLQVKAGRVDYVKLVETISVSWKNEWSILETNTLAAPRASPGIADQGPRSMSATTSSLPRRRNVIGPSVLVPMRAQPAAASRGMALSMLRSLSS